MRKLLLSLTILMLSAAATAQQYGNSSPFAFRPVVGATYGEVGYEHGDERDTWASGSLALDFVEYPVELEFRYGTADRTATILGVNATNTWSNFGVGVKLDLSRRCSTMCLYLLAGYNYGENEIKLNFEGETSRTTLSGNYPHVGAGFRYNLTDNTRFLVEWTQYNVATQDYKDLEIDFGHSRIWQGGMAFTF